MSEERGGTPAQWEVNDERFRAHEQVPVIRGMAPIPPSRYTDDPTEVDGSGQRANRPYYARSYGAQYGLPFVEEDGELRCEVAEEIIKDLGGRSVATHTQVENRILAYLRQHDKIRRDALNPYLMGIGEAVAREEERRNADRKDG